jgi:hypothetical protein
MKCDEWRKLLERCYEAEKAHQDAVEDMNAADWTDLGQATARVETLSRVRQDCERALIRHEQTHNCWRRKTSVAKAS